MKSKKMTAEEFKAYLNAPVPQEDTEGTDQDQDDWDTAAIGEDWDV